MSFGASNTTKTGMNDISGAFGTAVNQQLPMFNTLGTNLFNLGNQTTQPGVNFFNQLLQGNRAATSTLLQPQLSQITGNQQAALNAISTLMPRGGGRYASLFGQSLQPLSSVQSLFNPMQGTAATALPQIGLQQSQLGTNLFNMGNQALQTGGQLATALTGAGQRQQEMSNALAAGLGGSLFSLLTAPLNPMGAGTLLGKGISSLGGLFSTPSINPYDSTFGVYG